MKTQKGFTLIELIIVIVVLGILAVTAAPQFFNFSSDARESTVKGLVGSINGAKDIIFGKSAIAGIESKEEDTCETTGDQPCLVEGVEVSFGYPIAAAEGIQAALNVSSGDWTFVADNGTASATAAAPADGSFGIHPNGVDVDFTVTTENGDSCHVLYTEATSTAAASVSSVTGGC